MSRRTKRRALRGGGRFVRKERKTNWPAVGVMAVFLVVALFWALREPRGPTRPVAASNSHLPTCPVGGMPINFAVSVPSDQGPVFFCCEHCIEKYRADPATYAAGVEAERLALTKLPRVQVRCPVSGGEVDRAVFIERDGEKTYFSSDECREKFQADPATYRASLAASYLYQTKCPVSGRPIDPGMSAALADGTTIYLCSPACREVFLRDPSKYANQLAEQGVRISP